MIMELKQLMKIIKNKILKKMTEKNQVKKKKMKKSKKLYKYHQEIHKVQLTLHKRIQENLIKN